MEKVTMHIKATIDVDLNEQLASMEDRPFAVLMQNLPEIIEIRKQRATANPLLHQHIAARKLT